MNSKGRLQKMKLLLSLILVAAPCIAIAQSQDQPKPGVEPTEAMRRGDEVRHVIAETEWGANGDPLAPPANDNSKWFITLITMDGCAHCDKLKNDLQTSKYLQAFVVVNDPTKSWAHFNVYKSGDKTQDWRFAKINVAGYPTLIIQPPRSGQFGDPKTVVKQLTGYDGNDKKLAEKIRDSIQTYARLYVKQNTVQAETDKEQTVGQQPVGIDPPFTPARPSFPLGPNKPNQPTPQPDQVLPVLPNIPNFPNEFPPTVNPTVPTEFPLDLKPEDIVKYLVSLLGGGSMATYALIALVALKVWELYRKYRKDAGLPVVFTDEQVEWLENLVNGLKNPPTQNTQTQSPTGR